MLYLSELVKRSGLHVLTTIKLKKTKNFFFSFQSCSSSQKFSQAIELDIGVTENSSPVFRSAFGKDPSVAPRSEEEAGKPFLLTGLPLTSLKAMHNYAL